MVVKKISRLLIAVLILSGCRHDPDLVHIQRFAGSNISELNKVLNYFKDDPDTLKLAAAQYLIDHMGNQYFTEEKKIEEKIKLISSHPEFGTDQIREMTDSFEAVKEPAFAFRKKKIVADAAVINSEFLIDHIEGSFHNWQTYDWADHLSFDQFCEYLLPYKITNSRPEPWLDQYYDLNKWLLDSISRTDVEALLHALNKEATDRWRWHFVGLTHRLGPSELEKVRAGDCTSFAEWVTYRCRSLGLPVVYIYTPQWANHKVGHAWNAFIGESGKLDWYTVFSEDPRSRPTKAAKIFMRTYRPQETSFKAYAEEIGLPPDDIPWYLRTSNIVDITDSLISIATIKTKISRKNPIGLNHAFLCIFNYKEWQAIHWSVINKDEVTFSNMGRDVLYMPMFYKKGKYFPAADPVIIPFEGPASEVKPIPGETIDMVLERKYPLGYLNMFYGNWCMVDAIFSGSNDSSFPESEKLGTFSAHPWPDINYSPKWRDRLSLDMYWKEIAIEQSKPYRFIMVKPAGNNECIIGELEFYDEQNKAIIGEVAGSASTPETIFDGFEGEDYIDTNPGGWVKIDFGKPIMLSRIRYLLADDSNRIQIGDMYELFYWNDEWISLGKQVAKERYLHYKGPAGALFWLRDLDRGEEERIFTYEDGQVWW